MTQGRYVYGRHPVSEALRGRAADVRKVYLSDVTAATRLIEIGAAAQRHGIPTVPASKKTLERLVGDVPHQGVVAEMAPFAFISAEASLSVSREAVPLPIATTCTPCFSIRCARVALA